MFCNIAYFTTNLHCIVHSYCIAILCSMTCVYSLVNHSLFILYTVYFISINMENVVHILNSIIYSNIPSQVYSYKVQVSNAVCTIYAVIEYKWTIQCVQSIKRTWTWILNLEISIMELVTQPYKLCSLS